MLPTKLEVLAAGISTGKSLVRWEPPSEEAKTRDEQVKTSSEEAEVAKIPGEQVKPPSDEAERMRLPKLEIQETANQCLRMPLTPKDLGRSAKFLHVANEASIEFFWGYNLFSKTTLPSKGPARQPPSKDYCLAHYTLQTCREPRMSKYDAKALAFLPELNVWDLCPFEDVKGLESPVSDALGVVGR